MADPKAGGGSLAARLQRLVRTVHPVGRDAYTLAEIVEGIEKAGGPKVSREYIHLLMQGKRDNPTKKLLEAIAAFFQVSPAYFFDDQEAQRIRQALEALALIRDAGARRIAARATGLPQASQQALEELADHLRQLAGLGPAAEQPSPEQEALGAGDADSQSDQWRRDGRA